MYAKNLVKLFATVLISRTTAYAQMSRRGLWFIFNLRIKKQYQSFTYQYSYNNRHTYESIFLINTDNFYILERLGVVSTVANESILAPLLKQTESSFPPSDMRRLDCFPCQWLGLAIFQLGLPRSCC